MPKGKGYPMPKYTPKSASKPGNPHKSYDKGNPHKSYAGGMYDSAAKKALAAAKAAGGKGK